MRLTDGARIGIAPGLNPGEVSLDFLVAENKPWYAYFQISNTGTDSTNEIRERFGFTHNQLTNRDDILAIDWLNAGGDDVNALATRYQAPFWGSKRPLWMTRRRERFPPRPCPQPERSPVPAGQ